MPRIYLILALLVTFLTACTIPETPTQTFLPQITATFTPTASQTPEPTLTVTPSPTNSARSPLNANPTNVSGTTGATSVNPAVAPNPTQVVSLKNREPSFEELQNFLGSSLKNIWREDQWAVEVFYEDVNGDEATELIVLHSPEIFVLSWTGMEYVKTFYLNGGCGTRCFPGSYVNFEDWTNDGASEIVFDNSYIGGGSSYWTYDLKRWVIRCSNSACNPVWEASILSESDDYNESAMGRYFVQTSLVLQDGIPGIRTVSKGFWVFTAFPGASPEYTYTALETNATIVSVYLWNGASFELSSEETFSLPSSFDSKSALFAENKKGWQAGIQLIDEEGQDFFNGMNQLCQIIINGVSTDPSFSCKSDFTTVLWQDITGDGQEDVVVQALWGSDPGETYPADCAVQQRLIAYTWDGQTATLIADASGCVTRPEDLYGVRLEDYDSDGLPEIIAAQLDADNPERIYKFNGTEFVFWSAMP